MVTLTLPISLPNSCASPSILASLRRWACRSCSTIFLLDSVAATASFFGKRKLRAYPDATLTTWPRLPSFSMSSLSMTSMPISSRLELRRERQQRDVARFLDGVGETPLVRRAHARDAARNDLPALRHKGVQHLHVLVIDVVDALHAEAAHLLAPEILLLLRGDRFVAAGGTLSRAAWSSFGFGHELRLLRHAGHGGRRFRHLLRQGRLSRGRRCRSRSRPLGRPLVPLLLPFVQPLQRLVDAHRNELQNDVRDAQAALQFLHAIGFGRELEQHIGAFAILIDAIRQAALAPLFDFVHRCPGRSQLRSQLLYELIDFFVRSIRLHDKQLFVNPHASSSVKPGARRLNLVMAFATPSAIMERTAS